jgi:hypothetical protein
MIYTNDYYNLVIDLAIANWYDIPTSKGRYDIRVNIGSK